MVLPEERVYELMRKAQQRPGYEITVDLREQALYDTDGFQERFEIDPFVRERLLEGLDDIAMTLQRQDEIAAFEAKRPRWLAPAGD